MLATHKLLKDEGNVLKRSIIEHALYLLKTKLKAERPINKQQLKMAAVKAWQSVSRKERKHLVVFIGFRLQAVVDCKGFASEYYN